MSDDIRIRLALDGAQEVQQGAQRAAEAVQRFGAATQQAGQRTQLSGQQMAQVSAQLQDLFVQIQAGGSPITALLQQGSQLSSVFGGFGNALRGVASLVSPTVVVLGAAAATVGSLAAAYAKGSAEADAYRRAIVLTGNAAGVTVGQLQDMARAQGELAGTQARAAEVLAALANSGSVARAQLAAAADAAIRLERAGGPAAEETAKKFAKLGEDPVRALAELNKAENFLTEGIYRQVKALQEQGRTAEAAALAQSTYAATIGQRAETLATSLGTLERGWLGVKDKAKAAWDAMLNVGRPESPQQQIDKVAADLQAARDKLAQAQNGEARLPGLDTGRIANAQQRRVQSLEAELRYLQQVEGLERRRTASQREAAAAVEATIKAEQGAAKVRGDALRLVQEEASAREKAIGLTGTYAKSLDDLQKLRGKGLLTEQQYIAAVRDVIDAQPIIREQLKAEEDARKAVARAMAEQIKAADQQLAAVQRSADSVADQVRKLQDEEQAAALAARQNITLAQAIQEVAIARLEEQRAKALAVGDVETLAALRAEIDARRQLATLMDSREARTAATRAADDAARDWARAAQDIERSLTDALLRGFESGKGFAKTLRDTLVNMFQTLVLRPIIQPIVGGITGSLGLSGTASAAGQVGQGASMLSSLGSLLSGTGVVGGGTLGLANTFTLGSQLALAGQTGTGLSTAAQLIGQGNYGAGLSTGAGTLAPWAVGLGAGYFGGRAISNGYAVSGSGNGLVTAGTAIGAVFGGPIGAAIGGAIAGGINRAFGRRPREVTEAGITGSIGGGDLTGQTFEDWQRKGGWFRSTKRGTDLSAIDAELEMGLDMSAKAILEGTKAWAQALALPAEQLASITTTFRTQLTGDAAKDQEAIAAVLQGYSDALTSGFASQLAPFRAQGETAAQTLERLAGSLLGVNDVLGVLGQSLLQVSTAGGDSAAKLLEQFGGLQQFQSAAGQFLADYYTEAEKTALATQELSRQLATVGVALPASRDAYRDLVEAQDLSTEAGRKAYAALLQLAPQFAALVPAITDLGSAAAEAARLAEEAAERQREAGRRVLEDLTRTSGDLQVELLQAQGKVAEAAALQRQQTLAGLTAGLSATDAAAVAALLDLNTARRAEIDAMRATQTAAQQAADEAARAAAEAEQRAQAVAGQRDGLVERLLQLQGNTAALRERELAALDPTNRALQEQINALLDQQTAAEAAARASEQAAQALQAFQGVLGNLADQRADLEAQLLTAQGRGGEAQALIRQRELARLTAGLTAEQAAQVVAAYDANAALRAQIQATTDAAQAAQALAAEQARAAEEAQRAAEQFRSAWQSVSDTLFDEVARIRGLISSGPGGLTLAGAQAQFAITTAQARAGDQEAAKLLPGLSQTLLELATANAGSLLELNRIRAAIAASLEQTGSGLAGRFGLTVPKLSTGTNLVPRDMLALLHEGEAVVPRPFNPAAGGANSPEVVQEIRQLLDAVQAGDLATVRQLGELLRIVKLWDGNGLPETRVL